MWIFKRIKSTLVFLLEILKIWPGSSPGVVSDFYLAGGRPNWSDWTRWDKHQKAEAIHTFDKISRFEELTKQFAIERDEDRRMAIAEAMAEFDDGDLAREMRKQRNREALS